MAELNTIFGADIKVGYSPPVHRRQFAGFPGAHGLTSLYLGTRGYEITVTGTIWTLSEPPTYAAARALMQTQIDLINSYGALAPATYTHQGDTYYNVVFGPLKIIPSGGDGKTFHWTAAGYCTCRFSCTLISLGG